MLNTIHSAFSNLSLEELIIYENTKGAVLSSFFS